jgi:hypothetical protein
MPIFFNWWPFWFSPPPPPPPPREDRDALGEGPFYYDKLRNRVVEVLKVIDAAARTIDVEDQSFKPGKLYLVQNVATGVEYSANVFDLEGERWNDDWDQRWFEPIELNEMEVLARATDSDDDE